MSHPDRIRVLQLGSPTGLYGAERWILALIRHMARDRIDSFVGTIKDAPGARPALCAAAEALGVKTQVFEAHGKLSVAAIRQLRAFITANSIDVLHTHFYKTDIIGCLAVRGTNCRTVSTPHGWSKNAGIKLRLYEALDRFVFRHFDAVVPLSEDLFNGLARSAPLRRSLHLIHNGLDLSEVDARADSPPELAEWRNAGRFLVGYVGQLIPRKSVDTLIRGVCETRDSRVCLAIVGEGPERVALEALTRRLGAQDRVRFFGYRDDRMAFIKSFDLFVLPSRLEGIPRCLMEAMSAGVAVIATDIPGCRELVESADGAALFAPGDHAHLARLVDELVAAPALREMSAAAGRERVRSKYSAERMAEAYTDLYERLVRPARTSVEPAPATQTE